MKTKITIFLLVTTLITLSFTFASVSKVEKKKSLSTEEPVDSDPVGGLGSEDKF